MTRRVLRGLVAAALLLATARTAGAFDQSVHYTVIYAVAVMAGYTPDDAQTIARASQSLDDNTSTTAFDAGNIPAVLGELGEVLRFRRPPEDITHMAPGQVFHSLTSDRNRAVIAQAHVERMRRFRSEPGPQTPERRRTELMYLGQYLHFVADMFVHPPDPLLGHGPEGHDTDRANLATEQLVRAIGAVRTTLDQFGGARGASGDPTRVQPVSPAATGLVVTGLDGRHRQLAQIVADSWARTYPDRARRLADTYSSRTERERAALSDAAVARALQDHHLEYRFYRADRDSFRYDSEGNAIGLARGVPGVPPPFVTATAAHPSLLQERRWAIARSIAMLGGRAARAARELAGEAAQAARVVPGALVQPTRLFVTFPQTPGGVALDPDLEMRDLRGRPRLVTVDGDRLVLETSEARYAIDRVHPRTFAAVLRALVAGQVPYLSIGTEPSDRPGYARVTYAPAFRGTREGRVMLEADLRFKALMTDLPLARSGGASPSALFAARFPSGGGEFARLWITGRGFVLSPDGARLAVRSRDMRIEAERTLGGRVRHDAALAAYSAALTGQWQRLTELFWELGAVEDLALATGVAFWARRNAIAIEPALALLAPRTELTPDYAPLLARWDGAVLASGGVTLTPEDRHGGSGYALLSFLMQAGGGGDWHAEGTAPALILMALAIAAVSLVLPPTALWLLARALDRAGERRRLWRRLTARWALAVLVVLLLAAATHSVIAGDALLGPFDRDFLAFLVGVVAFPTAVLALLRSWLRTAAPAARAAAVVVAILGAAVAGQAGVASALLTVAIVGPVPTPAVNTVLSLQLAAADRFSEGLMSSVGFDDGPGVVLLPRSALQTAQRGYGSPPLASGPPPPELHRIGTPDPMHPFDVLQRVPVERAPAGVGFYAIDGRLPF